MFDENGRFVIADYQKKGTFSSFLPGIAGPMGVPVWCYYNNRGQAVCSFGAQDKDHAIMEFDSAHAAYKNHLSTFFQYIIFWQISMPPFRVTAISSLERTFTVSTSWRTALSSHSVMWGDAFSKVCAASMMR